MSEVAPFDEDASWNVDTLKRHTDALFALRDVAVVAALVAQEKAVAAALAAQKEAVNKAENASEKRFESVNEFRAQLADQNKTFATRADFDNLKETLNKLELAVSRTENKDVGINTATDRLFQIVPIMIALALAAIAFWSMK